MLLSSSRLRLRRKFGLCKRICGAYRGEGTDRRDDGVRVSGAEPPNGREGRGADTETQLVRRAGNRSGKTARCSAWCWWNGFGSRPFSVGSKWDVASVGQS